AIAQLAADDAYRGRVMSLVVIVSRGLTQASQLQTGVATALVGAPAAAAIGALLVGGVVVGAATRVARLRDFTATAPPLTAPLATVEATPFQRDLSRTHAQRLADAIGASGLFLDPVIAVPSRDAGFWSPNGRHRLAAAKELGLRSITALLTDDPALAYRILALNTEKAHNLRDRALEVIRMARSLAREAPRSKESEHVTSFESPAFLTLG